MEALTWQNVELLLRILEQSHPEVNRDEHEEEEHNNHTNSCDLWEEDRREDDHLEDNFREHDHLEQGNRRANRQGN
jgi:hypothetical protein